MSLAGKIQLAGRHPAAAADWLRMKAGGFRARRRLSAEDTAPPPIVLSVNLTSRCNLRCRMCGQWRREDWNRGPVLPASALLEAVSGLRPGRVKIYLWGGEPLLYPHFRELIAGLGERSHYVVVNTNGVLLRDFAADLVSCGVAALDVSVDGPPEIHDRIRGVPGTFERMAAGLQLLAGIRKREGSRRPMVKSITVVSETNQDRLEETAATLADTGLFDALVFNLGWFTDERRGEATRKIFQSRLGCDSTTWRDYVAALGKIDAERVADFAAKAASGALCRKPVFIVPPLSSSQVADYYRRPGAVFGRKGCVSPWLQAEIRPDGGVTFCPDFPDYIAGNIKSDSLLRIWNGPRARRFRRVLRENGLFPVCNRCCGFFSY